MRRHQDWIRRAPRRLRVVREPQFRLFGIPVRIAGSFALVAVMGLTAGSVEIALVWVAVVFVTTLVHELGHAFAFKYYGRESSITLWGLGGLTQGHGAPLSRARSIVVSLAGPLTEIVLVGLPALYLARTVETTSDTTALALDLFVWVGIGWAIVNLLPVLPLDGGRVLANVLEGLYGIKGARAARWIGTAIAGGAAAFAALQGFVFAAIFGLYFIAQNRNDLQTLRDAPEAERLGEGHDLLDGGDVAAAIGVAQDLFASAKNPLLAAAALHLYAWGYLVAGRREDAAAALARLPEDVRPSQAIIAYTLVLDGQREEALQAAADSMLEDEGGIPPNAQLALLFEREGMLDELVTRLLASSGDNGAKAVHVIAYQLHRARAFEASARLGARLFDDGRIDRGNTAFNVACSLARLGETDDAQAWLERAAENGFSDPALWDADEDLAPLRGQEWYQELKKRVEHRT